MQVPYETNEVVEEAKTLLQVWTGLDNVLPRRNDNIQKIRTLLSRKVTDEKVMPGRLDDLLKSVKEERERLHWVFVQMDAAVARAKAEYDDIWGLEQILTPLNCHWHCDNTPDNHWPLLPGEEILVEPALSTGPGWPDESGVAEL